MKIENPEMFKSQKDFFDYCCTVWKEVKEMTAEMLHGKTANEILCISGQNDSVPVDLKKVLESLKVSAIPFDFSKLEKKHSSTLKNRSILGAMVSNEKGTAILYSVNDKQDSHRARFTIAHEIAHCCLHGPVPHVEFRFDGEVESEEEIAANTFAGELLIPKDALLRVISQLIVPTVNSLADIFDVSINVMNKRIIHLNLMDKVVGAE